MTQSVSPLHAADAKSQAKLDLEHDRELAVSPLEIEQTPSRSPLEMLDNYSTRSLDRAFKGHLAQFTTGISPAGVASTFFTWWAHLALSPGKQLQLVEKAQRKLARLAIFLFNQAIHPSSECCIEPLPHDTRFKHPSWKNWPFNLFYQQFLLTQQWWYNATNDIDGVSDRDEQVLSFVTRQILDHFSPSNYLWTNPEILEETNTKFGTNLITGFQHFLEDWERAISGKPPVGTETFTVGRNLASTPGKVVFRNHLIELIQYTPTTEKVYAEPMLIVPAWIMKYYILDLSPHNSLVKYLVEKGHTVFMISWRNPTSEDRDLGMHHYHNLGIKDALKAINAIVPQQQIHAVGYCIGGTLLASSAAAMARDNDERLKTITLFAAQTDFSEAGELLLFVRESEVSFLENMMWNQGFLDTKQMAGAFQLLRSNDLIWSRHVHEYLLGKREKLFDLLAWNADATRMPQRMHSEYLRQIFLDNKLAQGQYKVDGRPVTISDIGVPIFCVSTTDDHVAPWRSVFKIHLLADTDVTFVLTNGGHNAGIVSEPGHAGRNFQIHTMQAEDKYLPPDRWREQIPRQDGSWWVAWCDWLAQHSPHKIAPPSLGATDKGYPPLMDAPGSYVRQR